MDEAHRLEQVGQEQEYPRQRRSDRITGHPNSTPRRGLDEALRRGADVLRRAGIEQYRADAELLAAYLLGTGSQGIQRGSYGESSVTRAGCAAVRPDGA